MGCVVIVRSDVNALIAGAVASRLLRDGSEIVEAADASALAELEAVTGVVIATDPPVVPGVVDAIASWERSPPVVLLSSPAAPHERSLPEEHQWFLPAERHLQTTELSWVIVRPVGLMAAALSWKEDLASGVVRHPYITAGYPHVHEHDIADVVVDCLAADDYIGQKLMVTGPESITPIEQAQSLSRALDRPVDIEGLIADQARQRWRDAGWDDDSIELELALLGDYVDGAPNVRDTVERVTGSPGRSFDQWAVEHANDFR